ncbi:unnamed protein product [Sphagnum compactum]
MATELLLSSIPSPASTPTYCSLLTSYAVANPRIPKLSAIFLLRNPCHSRDLKQKRIRGQQKRNTALLLHGYRGGGVVEASAEELAVQVSGQEEEEEVARVKFNDGSPISFAPILNGCWTLAGGHGVISEPRILETMELYAAHGLTTFDTADIYGPSEAILGKFREQWENRKRNQSGGDVHHQMQDLQVFTKLVPNIFRQKFTPKLIEDGVRKSMAALQVQKLDLVQLHWWDYSIPGMVDTAKVLMDLRGKGLITSIGTTNMSTEALALIVDAGVPVVCNQVQFSLLDQRPRELMLKYCKARNIKLLTYGTLAGGLLSDRYSQKKGLFGKYTRPDLNTSSLQMYWRIVKEAGGEEHWHQVLSILAEISGTHGVSIPAVALRWAMQQGPVHPIVGLRNSNHLHENLTALTFSLTPPEMEKIEAVLAQSPGPQGDCYEMERGN